MVVKGDTPLAVVGGWEDAIKVAKVRDFVPFSNIAAEEAEE